MEQLTIDFDKNLSLAYPTLVEFCSARVHQQKVLQKVIAADMDLAPSQLSQKLGPKGQSSARFTCDDLETYIEKTGDKEPVKYLVSKYLVNQSEDELRDQIEALKRQLASKKNGR